MARLAVWNPMREMSRLSSEMNSLMEDLWGGREPRESLRGAWIPAADIQESADELKISLELPGMTKDDVEVTIDNGVLSIRGERQFEDAKEGETYHRVERSYGQFERAFQMPRSVDPEKVKARFDNGVLTLSLAKREESKPKQIQVDVK